MPAPSASVRLPFAAIVLAMLPAVLDQTILATALPTIAADLGRLSDLSWVVSAYVVAAAASTPLWGKLGDRHGRKRLLELALVLFLAASALCGVAHDITVLIAARTAQGAGAGGLMTLAMAAVGDLVSPRERARYQGYIAATFAVATVAGPLVGGLLVDHAGWRWVFYVNVPLGVAALGGLRLRFPRQRGDRTDHPLDLLGAALLAGATSALTLACIWGGGRYSWSSATVLSLLSSSVVLGAALAVRERRAGDPIVPLDLLRTRTVAVASAALFLATAALFAVNVFVPLFLQTTTGATPTQAGLLLVPMMLGITVSTNLAGRAIERTGRYKRFPIIGLALMTVALAGLAVVAREPSRTTIGAGLAVFGLGFGMVGQVLIVAVQNGVDRRRLGIAMATTSFFRGLGGALGAAALGAVFAARLGASAAVAGQGGVASLTSQARGEVIDAVQAVFIVAAPIAALALVVVVLLREVPLRGTPPTPDRSRSRPMPDDALQASVLLRSERSDEHLGVIAITVPAGWPGPPLHHHDFDEAFYVLEGELTFQLATEVATAGPGSLTFARRGSRHTLANLGDAEARYLLVCTPGGFERRFDRLAAEAAGSEPPPDALKPYPETIVVGPQIARR